MSSAELFEDEAALVFVAVGEDEVDVHTVRELRIGHVDFGEDTLFAFKVAAIRARFDRPSGQTVKDNGYSLILEVRHRFTPWMEGIASASRSDVLGWKTTEYVAGPMFHVSKYVALGTLYRRMEGHSGLEATVRWYY